MNRYLDKELGESIKARALRFDDRSLVGKVVANYIYSPPIAGLLFADGTWCAVEAVDDCCDGADLDHVWEHMQLHDLRDLGLVTKEQYQEADAKKQQKDRELTEYKIKLLQDELRRTT